MPPRAPANRLGARLSITAVLTLGFGGLALVAGASGLWFGSTISGGNRGELARLEAEVAAAAISERAGAHLRPVHDALVWVAARISVGQIGPTDVGAVADALDRVLLDVPTAVAATFAGINGDHIRLERVAAGVNTSLSSWDDNSHTARSIAVARTLPGPAWIPDIHPDNNGKGRAEILTPVRNGQVFAGVVSVAVNVVELTLDLGLGLTTARQSAFLLANGHRLLAHDSLADGVAMPLDQPADPILAEATGSGALEPPRSGSFGEVRVDRPDGQYVVIYRALSGIAHQDGVVGIHYREDLQSGARSWMLTTALVLLGLFLASALAALLIGAAIDRPIRAMVRAAESVGRLDFAHAEALPNSRIKELDKAARGFDAMQTGLRWFEDYVPNGLVRRLMAEASRKDEPTEIRKVTVMFVRPEIPIAYGDDEAAEIFVRIAELVESEDGTVDRYFDKVIMAFWGTPQANDDDAVRACRAAQAIVRATRQGKDQLAARIRVGIHVGAALPVTIGSETPLNHTVVGNAVNVARNVLAADDIGASEAPNGVILVTDSVVSEIGDAFTVVGTGARLIDEADASYEVSILAAD